jgi:hypothetical protein
MKVSLIINFEKSRRGKNISDLYIETSYIRTQAEEGIWHNKKFVYKKEIKTIYLTTSSKPPSKTQRLHTLNVHPLGSMRRIDPTKNQRLHTLDFQPMCIFENYWAFRELKTPYPECSTHVHKTLNESRTPYPRFSTHMHLRETLTVAKNFTF